MSRQITRSGSPSDGDDTQMTDSADLLATEQPSTPPSQLQSIPSSELSPPDSHGGPRLSQGVRVSGTSQQSSSLSGQGIPLDTPAETPPTTTVDPTAPPSDLLNSNGKRTYNGAAGTANASVAGSSSAANNEGGGGGTNGSGTHKFTHASGYTWEREEDAPGYSWTNKKSHEEMLRACGGVVDWKDQVRGSYGDVLLDSVGRET